MTRRAEWWVLSIALASSGLGTARQAIAQEQVATRGVGHVTIGATAGTLGAGGSLAISLTPWAALRTGYNTFVTTFDQDLEGIAYDAHPRLKSVPLLLDLRPSGGGFHFTGGILFNQSELQTRAHTGGGVEIGSRAYSSNEVSSLTGRITARRQAPYVGLGFGGTPRGGGRFSLALDLGIVAQGLPHAELTGVTTLSGAEREQFQRDVTQEQGELQRAIDDLPGVVRLYPVLSLGLTVGVL